MQISDVDPAPVFIVGAPRSGTTLLLELLAAHPDLCWVSEEMNTGSPDPSLARRERIYGLPFLGPRLYAHRPQLVRAARPTSLRRLVRRHLPYPVEPWAFLTTVLPGFWPRPTTRQPNHPPDGSSLTDADVNRMGRMVTGILEASHSPRFLAKFAEYAHIGYMRRIFPTSRFVHIVRDGRAVAYSYLEKIASGEWRVWPSRQWYVDGWPATLRDDWAASDKSQLTFAVLTWKHYASTILAESADPEVAPCVHLVRYERLVSDPFTTLEGIVEFADLTPGSSLIRAVRARRLRSGNWKWRSELDQDSRAQIDALVYEPHLRALLEDEAV